MAELFACVQNYDDVDLHFTPLSDHLESQLEKDRKRREYFKQWEEELWHRYKGPEIDQPVSLEESKRP
jgi:hypothetical protein